MLDFDGIDIGRAFLAVGLALALWLVLQAELNPERADAFDVAVEPRNVPAGLIVTNAAEWRTVEVRLSAPRDLFAQLRASQLRAYVDLSRATIGETSVPVELPPLDPGVHVLDTTPRRVAVRLEERVRKAVPVQPRVTGNPPFGYRAGRASLGTDTVTITGPASFVRRVEGAEVEVRVDSATGDIATTQPPTLLTAQGERITPAVPGVEIQPAAIRVQVPISQQLAYKEVGVHPVLRGAVPAGYWVQRVTVEPSVVTVLGDPEALAEAENVDTEPVELSDLTSSVTRPTALRLPPGLALARTQPLTMTIQVSPLVLRQTLRVPVDVLNVGPDLYAVGEVPVVEIVANGPADQGLSPASVQATVDAAALDEGAYTLTVRVRLPERFTLESVRPVQAGISLREAGAPTPTPLPVPTATVAPEPTPVEVLLPATATPVATAVAPSPTATPTSTASLAPTAGGAVLTVRPVGATPIRVIPTATATPTRAPAAAAPSPTSSGGS